MWTGSDASTSAAVQSIRIEPSASPPWAFSIATRRAQVATVAWLHDQMRDRALLRIDHDVGQLPGVTVGALDGTSELESHRV